MKEVSVLHHGVVGCLKSILLCVSMIQCEGCYVFLEVILIMFNDLFCMPGPITLDHLYLATITSLDINPSNYQRSTNQL